jgi:hypothetical protein
MNRGIGGVLLGVVLGWAAVLADAPVSLEEAATAANAAWHAQDENALRGIRAELASSTTGEDPGLAAYYLAWIDYRIATIGAGAGASGTRSSLESCERILTEQLAENDEFGEAWLLLAACRWQALIAGDMGAWSGVPQALSAEARGMRLAGESPRAPLVDAIGLLRRPESLGGNSVDAEKALQEGLRRFAASPPVDDGILNWGLDDLWLRLGDLYWGRADRLRARDAYEQVLLLVPESRIARQRLEALQTEPPAPTAGIKP